MTSVKHLVVNSFINEKPLGYYSKLDSDARSTEKKKNKQKKKQTRLVAVQWTKIGSRDHQTQSISRNNAGGVAEKLNRILNYEQLASSQ